MRKKLSIILVVVVALSTNLFAQTVQERRQISALENEIIKTKKEVVSAVDRGEVQSDIVAKKAKIADLERERENIFRRYATASDVPKELAPREFRRRQRADFLKITERKDEIIIKKIEARISSPSSSISPSIDPSGSPVANAGYKVIVANDYPLPIMFTFHPLDGRQDESQLVSPSKKEVKYLLPGKYIVSFEGGGNSLDRLLTIDGTTQVFKGEDCFGFAYMPRF